MAPGNAKRGPERKAAAAIRKDAAAADSTWGVGQDRERPGRRVNSGEPDQTSVTRFRSKIRTRARISISTRVHPTSATMAAMSSIEP